MVLAVPPPVVQLVEHAVRVELLEVSVDLAVLSAPATPVAEKVIGLPDRPPDVAVRVFECDAMLSSTQLPTVAMPVPPVVAPPPVTLPLVAATLKVTPMPDTPFP